MYGGWCVGGGVGGRMVTRPKKRLILEGRIFSTKICPLKKFWGQILVEKIPSFLLYWKKKNVFFSYKKTYMKLSLQNKLKYISYSKKRYWQKRLKKKKKKLKSAVSGWWIFHLKFWRKIAFFRLDKKSRSGKIFTDPGF